MEKKSVAATNEKVSTYIPDEISYSILSKLSVKSLKRFECVQKSWSLLFENHHFMNMFLYKFLSYNEPASLILRAYENGKEVFYSFSGERFENKVKLDWSNPCRSHLCTNFFGFGSINGTFCLYASETIPDIALWTPATQKSKILPTSEAEELGMFIPNSITFYIQGFGYDRVTNDYKVIRYVDVVDSLSEYSMDNIEELDWDHSWEIYSLRSNSWRKLHIDMPYSLQFNHGTQVYIDGVCHWLCEEDCEDSQDDSEDSEDYSNVRPCLVSFYLSNEEFVITPIPSDVDDCIDVKSWIKLAVLNGSIALISYHEEESTFHISILGEIGMEESWIKLIIVGPLSCVERPIGVGMKGEIVFIRKDEKLVWLDLSTQMIAELGYKGRLDYYSRIVIYKESILPIEGISN